MGVVSFGATGTEIFPLRRGLFRLLLDRAESNVTEPQAAAALRLASALDALLLERIAPEQIERVAPAVATACREIRGELSPGRHQADQDLHTVLLQIEARSQRLVDGPSKFDVLGG